MPIHSKLAVGLTLLLTVYHTALTLTRIINAPAPVEHSDKIYHVLAFAVLAFQISLFRPSWLPYASSLLTWIESRACTASCALFTSSLVIYHRCSQLSAALSFHETVCAREHFP